MELVLKHVSPWCLDRLLECPGVTETFWVARSREVRAPGALPHLLSHSFKQLSPTSVRIDDNSFAQLLRYFERKSPEDYLGIQPHLDRLLAEWKELPLDLEKNWRWLASEVQSYGSRGVTLDAGFLKGGTPLGPDLGYGSLRYYTPTETLELADSLDAKLVLLREVMDSDAVPLLDAVVRYYEEAAHMGNAMLLAFE